MSDQPSGHQPRTVINGFLSGIKLAAGNPTTQKTVALPVGQEGHVTAAGVNFTTLTTATGVTVALIRPDGAFLVTMINNAVQTRSSYSIEWVGRVAFDNTDGEKSLLFQFNRNTTNDVIQLRYTFEVDIN